MKIRHQGEFLVSFLVSSPADAVVTMLGLDWALEKQGQIDQPQVPGRRQVFKSYAEVCRNRVELFCIGHWLLTLF